MARACVLLLVALGSGIAEEPFERVLQLASVRRQMSRELTRLPDYTCLATVQRAVQSPKDRDPRLIDTLRYEVAHAGGKELFSWPGAARFEDRPVTSMIQNGSISEGDFAGHARSIFVDGSATVKFAGT